MSYILLYADNPSRSDLRQLQQTLGYEVRIDSVLPALIGPLESDDRARALLAELKRSCSRSGRVAVILDAGGEPARAAKVDVARLLVESHSEWKSLLSEYPSSPSLRVRMQFKEHPRCWVVAASVEGQGLPPGLGFIVDKHTGAVMRRRLVDVVSVDGSLR